MDTGIENKVFDVLYKGNISWTVNKEQLYTEDQKIATGGFCTRRNDTGDVLGIVGSRYMPLQNHVLVQEFIEATSEFGLTEISGVAVNGGKKIVIKARVGDVQIGSDVVKRYITASNTHDGSSQVKLGMYNLVQVCTNGLHREISSHELAKVKHTTNAGDKMNWYIRNIPKVLAAEEAMIKTYKQLSEIKVNQKHIQAVIEKVWGVDTTVPEDQITTRKKNQVQEFDKALTGNGLNVHGDTLWGLLQASTYLTSHDKKGKVNIDHMAGRDYEIGNMTYELLMSMIDNPIYELEEAIN